MGPALAAHCRHHTINNILWRIFLVRTFMYTIKAPVGMHARHAGLLVQEAKKYASAVTFSLGERSADAKRILNLMGLGVKQGDLVKLTVEGEDEDQAALKLKAFMWENF